MASSRMSPSSVPGADSSQRARGHCPLARCIAAACDSSTTMPRVSESQLISYLSLIRDKPESRRPTECLNAIAYVKFIVNIGQVEVHCALTYEQNLRHFSTRLALNHVCEHFNFPLC